MPELTASVRLRGPLFSGLAQRALRAITEDVTRDVGQRVYGAVMKNLNASIQKPTPYYETQVLPERVTFDRVVVHDRGIIYGPWLEGTSSRNKTTRFKGYRSFRRAFQEVAPGIPRYVENVLRRRMGLLG